MINYMQPRQVAGYSESTSVLETGFGAIENTSIHHADSVVAGISPCQPRVFKPSTLFAKTA